MTPEQIKDESLSLLRDNEADWSSRYEGYISNIRDTSNRVKDRSYKNFEGLTLHSSIGRRKDNKLFDLRFMGQSIGELDLSGKLHPKNKNQFPYLTECSNVKEVQEFFDSVKKLQENTTGPKEAKIRAQLLKNFSKESSNITPIKLWEQAYFDMPVPLTASDCKKNGVRYLKGKSQGHIDIMARVKYSSTEVRICVIEVKDENKQSESQNATMCQALAYATFVAMLLKSTSGKQWWNFFMNHPEDSSEVPSHINIDVVTIMPEGQSNTYENKLISIQELNVTFHCHSLYYNSSALEKDNKFIFSGTYTQQLPK